MNKDRFKACRYIGDGVYAGFDGGQVWIWTSNGVAESAPIAVEDRTFALLTRYFADLDAAIGRHGEAIMELPEL